MYKLYLSNHLFMKMNVFTYLCIFTMRPSKHLYQGRISYFKQMFYSGTKNRMHNFLIFFLIWNINPQRYKSVYIIWSITVALYKFWKQKELHFTFWWILFLLFRAPWNSIGIENQLFHFYKICQWSCNRDVTESVNHFGSYCHVNNLKTSNLWTWEVLPFPQVFALFQPCFVVSVF